jgi:prolyl-tRNA editing enzyme YbaK/EbsC (Cys-tRNA(Pro) deacylase)
VRYAARVPSLLAPEVEAAVAAAGVVHAVVACAPELADTAAFCAHYGYAPSQAANTILVAGKADPVRYAACVVLATTKLDVNKRACALLGVKKASFASGDQTTALTGMMIGGVTLFGLPADLPIYVDAAVMACDRIIVGGGNRSSKLLLAPGELGKLSQVQVVDGLAALRPG